MPPVNAACDAAFYKWRRAIPDGDASQAEGAEGGEPQIQEATGGVDAERLGAEEDARTRANRGVGQTGCGLWRIFRPFSRSVEGPLFLLTPVSCSK